MSLRTRLLLLAALAVLLPVLFVSLRFFIDRGKQIDVATANLSVYANDLAIALNEKILGSTQLLYGLARARDLDTTDRKACSNFLSAVREEHPQYTGILTINPDGSLFCDSINTGRNLDLRDRKYFQQASSPNGGLALEPVFGRLTGIAVLQVAYPARGPSGELKFVLLASLNLEKFINDHAQRGTEILLMDLKGKVMAWSPAKTRGFYRGTSMAQQPLFAFATNQEGGAGEVVGIDGSRQVWAVAGLPSMRNAGLRILVGESRSSLVAPANSRLIADMVVLALAAVVLFLGVWLLVELGIRRQISRMVKMAQQLGAGNPHARIPPPFPSDELGALMLVLNGTAESLERQSADIADLNQKYHQAQKMEAMGQLTGGVAHDFNNMLTVIIGSAEALVEKLADNPDLRQRAGLVMAAAERGASLTHSLLAFARRQPLEPKSLDVNRHILQMENLLQRTFGAYIELRFLLGSEVAPALVDPGQLESAILNLAINARDAMPTGGRLTVETSNVHVDGTFARRDDDIAAGNYVMIAVADTGSGMAPDVLAQAFEPFFTTKDVGKGTGLGLSMVYGFVKQSGGHIKIYSEVGHGTIVKLYLPQANTAAAASSGGQSVSQTGKGETILVVEDDDLVREHVASEVRDLGYDVTTARNGAEALERLRRVNFDLLFSDVMMPGGLAGPALAREALRLRPKLKVLFTSGYTENTVMYGDAFDPATQLLSKPYRRQDLAAKLRAALLGAA